MTLLGAIGGISVFVVGVAILKIVEALERRMKSAIVPYAASAITFLIALTAVYAIAVMLG